MDERIWTDVPLSENDTLQVGGASITLRPCVPTSYLVSGQLSEALHALRPKVRILGLLEDCSGMQDYAIRIGRDSALLVTHDPLQHQHGWNDTGFGLSDASDLYSVFIIAGSGADFVLAQAGIGDKDARSASAAIRVAELTVLLVRCADEYHMWVPQAHTTYMTSFFSGVAQPVLIGSAPE